jgi:hypothetical protein
VSFAPAEGRALPLYCGVAMAFRATAYRRPHAAQEGNPQPPRALLRLRFAGALPTIAAAALPTRAALGASRSHALPYKISAAAQRSVAAPELRYPFVRLIAAPGVTHRKCQLCRQTQLASGNSS